MSHNKLAAVCCCLGGSLLLGIPIDGSLLHKVEDTCNRMTCKHVMVQIGIHILGEGHMSSNGFQCILGNEFGYVTIYGLGPVILCFRYIRVIWLLGMHAYLGIPQLVQVAIDMLDVFEVTASSPGLRS